MQQHHRDAIERWAEAAADDDEVLAVVVAGSLTKGYGLADSDVDGFVIVTDEAFARRRAHGELTFFSDKLCDYEGGYIDAKYVDRAFLEAVAGRGSEPAGAAACEDRHRFRRRSWCSSRWRELRGALDHPHGRGPCTWMSRRAVDHAWGVAVVEEVHGRGDEADDRDADE